MVVAAVTRAMTIAVRPGASAWLAIIAACADATMTVISSTAFLNAELPGTFAILAV